jgi:hypothetical protein
MDRMRCALGALLVTLAVPLASAGDRVPAKDAAAKPLVLRAEVRATVDPSGTLTGVQIQKDLPEPVRLAVARQLASWKFERRRVELAGEATTWLSLVVCALPMPDGRYEMGLEYHGHGPRLRDRHWNFPEVVTKALFKTRFKGVIPIEYVVGSDGTSRMESYSGPFEDGDVAEAIGDALKFMVAINGAEPETVGGKPVATRMTYWLDWAPSSNGSAHMRWRGHVQQSPQCAAADALGPRAWYFPGTALDSVVGVEPVF